MKNRKISTSILVSILISTLLVLKYLIQVTLFLFPLCSAIFGIGQEACSVGIIGGADGPTTVFLSSPYRYIFLMPALEFLGIIFILITLLQCHSKFKKNVPE